ncbi:MAG: TonB-dependent receptor domain-containing protein [Sphingomicrobium sp.]
MRNSKTYLLATTLLAGVTISGPAFAQATSPAPPPSQDPNVQAAPTDQTPAQQENVADTAAQDRQDVEPGSAETIVVTGSRIVSPNIVSLAPIQVIGEQDIDRAAAINVQEVLLENPAFGTPLASTTNTAFSTSGAGAATVDLRDLGSNRTLVLINNRRVVGGFGGSSIVDLNVIPTQFVERIDVLTGGASSLYGSDAVAGVVNFIYKRNFEGLLMEGQYGITQRADYPRYQVSATAGANFADDRGNIMVHMGYSDDKGLKSRSRKNTRIDDLSKFLLYYDPADYGVEYQPYFSSFAQQGRFTTGDLNPAVGGIQSYTFTYGANGQLQPCFTTNGAGCDSQLTNAAGTVVTLPRLTGVNGGVGTGPNGFNRNFFRTLSTPVKRWLFAERGHFDVADNVSFLTEVTYSKTSAKTEIEPFALDTGGANPLFPGSAAGVWDIQLAPGGPCNPFVPAEICAVANDQNGNGLKDIAFRKRLTGVNTRHYTADRHLFRIVTGFEGKLFNDRWNWDLTYNFGRMEEAQISAGQVNAANFRNALNAIVDTADVNQNGNTTEIICADSIARAGGCVPINIFGFDSITPAMANYVQADTNHSFKVTQQVINANLSGSLIELPAGPLGLAVGAEYRKEQSAENWDALTNVGGNLGNALPDTFGQFNVKEAYAEMNVPIVKDLPFAKQLNLRAAGRVSDYSTVGTVKTWNVGGDYAPIDDLRFRATYAKAVRAPNIGELFTGPSQTFPTGLVDPCVGVTATSTGTTADVCRLDPGVLVNIALNGKFTILQADKQGVSGFTSGNPDLGAESSKSLTAGVVVNPKSINALRNLVLSVDYWSIKVSDAVFFAGRQLILNQCYQAGDPSFCQFITRYPQQTGASSPGAIQFVNVVPINASTFKASGIDAVLQYRTGLDMLLSGLTANARISYTRYLKGFVVPAAGLPADPFAGEVGTAKNKGNGTIAFNTRKWGLSFTGTYIGKSFEDDQFIDAANATRAKFGLGPPLGDHAIVIPAQFYLDSQISFTPIRNYEFFVGVDNLLDNKAPNLLSGTTFNNTGSDTAAAVYDIFGRRFYAGARLRF